MTSSGIEPAAFRFGAQCFNPILAPAFILIIITRRIGRPRRRWVDNIKMDLRGIKWDGIDWIELAQDRKQWRALVNTVRNLRVP
jgi:hypothetical protein